MRRFVVHAAGLTAVWVLLWGRLTLANVVTGLVVSSALLVVFPLEHHRRDHPLVVRPVAAARLLVHFLRQLIVSNLTLAWQIVRPHPDLHTGIVACPMHTRSDGLITVITNLLALSPGTMTVDVITPEGTGASTVFIHVLRLDDPDVTRRQVAKLERLVVGAFGVAAEVDACNAPLVDHPGAET